MARDVSSESGLQPGNAEYPPGSWLVYDDSAAEADGVAATVSHIFVYKETIDVRSLKGRGIVHSQQTSSLLINWRTENRYQTNTLGFCSSVVYFLMYFEFDSLIHV